MKNFYQMYKITFWSSIVSLLLLGVSIFANVQSLSTGGYSRIFWMLGFVIIIEFFVYMFEYSTYYEPGSETRRNIYIIMFVVFLAIGAFVCYLGFQQMSLYQ